MGRRVSGATALALGAIEAGVSLVTSYAGGPVTAVVDEIVGRTRLEDVRVEWTSNEKVALEMAFGGSMGGARSLLCVKSVGFNIALDPLMTLNLCGCNAGLVLLVGDDPGGWASQNEQDSRAVALATELPLLEPASVADAYSAMREAFELSEEMGLPVIVRITHALAAATGEIRDAGRTSSPVRRPRLPFQRAFMRWVVLPVNVVASHRRLLDKLAVIQNRFDGSPLNGIESTGSLGVLTAGFVYQKLAELVQGTIPSQLTVMRLGTLCPLPAAQIAAFLDSVQSVLVLEENAPLVERALRALAQQAGRSLPIYGRDTGHVPETGEILAPQLAEILNRLIPELALSEEGQTERAMPSRVPLCDGCPYIPTFDALLEVMEEMGGRERFVVVGDPGCMARSQLPPYQMLDVKISLGSSISIATGIALSQGRVSDPATAKLERLYPADEVDIDALLDAERDAGHSARWIVALSGDSSFLHTGLNGMTDAARVGAHLLVVILDNGTTALTGGQPHPASPVDARGQPRPSLDLAALARGAGAGIVLTVDLDRGGDIAAAIERGIRFAGVAAIIARGRCPRFRSGH